MSLAGRMLLINVILALGLAAQFGLNRHVEAGGGLDYAALHGDLDRLPMSLGSRVNRVSIPANVVRGASADTIKVERWQGEVSPNDKVIREKVKFKPDGLVSRVYRQEGTATIVDLYLAYSRTGEDRKHHPEVCIRDVTGAPEDMEMRKVLNLEGNQKRPIQRFRFRTSPTQNITVYYWHFALPRIPREGETLLQVLHQRGSQPAPSVTAQVTTTASAAELAAIENDFLVTLNQVLWAEYLPEGTVMGCDRIPIALQRK